MNYNRIAEEALIDARNLPPTRVQSEPAQLSSAEQEECTPLTAGYPTQVRFSNGVAKASR